MLVSSVITLLTIGSTSVSATNYKQYNLLKDDRAAGHLVFPPTTLAQKEVILSNVENAFAIWANYDSKKSHYGPAADPFPTIKRLRETIEKVSDEELQLGITDAFVKILVVSTSRPYALHLLFGKDYSKIKFGDELLAVNGLSFVDWFKQNKFKSGGGANVFGGQRAALKYLNTIYGAINRLPIEDSINFQFKSRANPKKSYTVNVPYVSGRNEDCWNLGSKLHKSLIDTTLPGTSETSLPVSAEQPGHSHKSDTVHPSTESHKMDSPKDPKRGAAIEKRSSSSQKSTILMNPTDVTQITWGIYKPESTNMGVIKLDGFSPEDVGTKSLALQKATMIVRSLLVNELKNTYSVIYELRGNSGGDADFANSLVQLFKPDFHPFGGRYLMNRITYNVFVNNKDPKVDPYAKVWKKTKKGNRFSNVLFHNSVESVNTLGQVYVRPMGVLNDARCYSSCEVFSGAIQSHGAGTIFGEDGQTGGGGAIVMRLDPLLISASPGDFKKFPFSQELASDTVVRPQWSDLQFGSTTNTQYDRIAASLARTGQENGQSKLHFVCEPFSFEKPISGFSLEVEAAGIYEFTVFQADGKTVIAKKRRSRAITKQKFSIPVSTASSALSNSQIIIVGKTAGKQVLKTIRNVRFIPTNDKYMKISNPGFTFSGLSDSVGLYQSLTTAPGDGWNNLKGSWVIGNGVKYVGSIDSSIEAFFSAPVGTKINIGLNFVLDSEPGFDFLYLSVKSNGGVENFLLRSKSRDGTKMLNGISGRKIIAKRTFPFTTKSEKFSVSLRFTSDRTTEFTGATIKSFTVSAA
ncbi:hypothetical protein BASA60_007216 [Batrachochytrium salamandrivorans]|nr:hypothetical protein BASA60_007216 [Batrachochytrium salamandrivorans]